MTRRGAIVAGVVALVLVAAAAAYGRLVPRIPGPAADAPAASFTPPGTVLAPAGAVPGLHLASVTELPVRAGGSRMTVYGRRGADPLAGPTLAALYHEGSEVSGLPYDRQSTGSALVNGHSAAVLEQDGDVWVTWPVWRDADQETDQYGVLARGLSRGEAVRAARHLLGRGGDPRIASRGLPRGFVPLGAGPASVGAPAGNGGGTPGGTMIRWSDERSGSSLTLTAVGVDGPAGVLVRSMARGPAVTLRGVPGNAGPGAGNRPGNAINEIARAWVAGGTGYLASARGLTDTQLDAVVADLRPVDAAGLAALAATAADYPLDRLVRPGETFVAGGRLPGGYWVVSTTGGAKARWTTTVRLPGGALSSGSGGPPPRGVLLFGRVSDVDGKRALIGRTEPPVATVTLVAADGAVTPVPLQPTAPDGGRWFGVLVESAARVTVVGCDASGREVAREEG